MTPKKDELFTSKNVNRATKLTAKVCWPKMAKAILIRHFGAKIAIIMVQAYTESPILRVT